MGRFSHAITTLNAARAGSLALLAAFALASPSARAMPPASGSKCSSNWVNNEGAMECFIQGEDEVNSGAAHPHYVACTAAGEVFCCVDNDKGNQDCVAEADTRRATLAEQVRAMLDAQRAIMAAQSRMSEKVDRLEGTIQELSGKIAR